MKLEKVMNKTSILYTSPDRKLVQKNMINKDASEELPSIELEESGSCPMTFNINTSNLTPSPKKHGPRSKRSLGRSQKRSARTHMSSPVLEKINYGRVLILMIDQTEQDEFEILLKKVFPNNQFDITNSEEFKMKNLKSDYDVLIVDFFGVADEDIENNMEF